MYKIFLLFVFTFSFSVAKAQKEWVNWNSATGGLTFKSGKGKLYKDVPANLTWPDYMGTRAYAYSDSLTGKMLFLTDGKNIWNRNYKSILNPKLDSLISCDTDYYKIQIVPFANDHSKFYLFHLYSGSLAGCPDKTFSYLYYSVLEMNGNNDSGKLISSNNPVMKKPLDCVALIKHANKKDTWVIGHPWDSSYYSAFLATDTMVYTAVISATGPHVRANRQSIKTVIAPSPNSNIIATSGLTAFVEIYNFDNSTGILSNYRLLRFPGEKVTALCFSPDNSKLYVVVKDRKRCNEFSKLYQVSFHENNFNGTPFLLKKYPPKTLELSKAKDNKIWIKVDNHFDVIEYPNQPGNACFLKENYLSFNKQVYFPNIISDYIQQPKETPIRKLHLSDTVEVCFGKNTINAGAGYESYNWNTGDTTQSIEVDRPGLYTVLVGDKNFSKPDAYGYVYVKSKAAELFTKEDTLFCPKTLHVLSIPQNITAIQWMDGDTSHVKPVLTDEYKLTGIDNNGCRVWDSICVFIREYPDVSFGNDTTLCPQQSFQVSMGSLDSSNIFNPKLATYLWPDNSTKNSFTINSEGTYWGSMKYRGCTVSDTIDVKYVALPEVNLGKDTSLCNGDSLTLYVAPSSANYLWSNGSTANTITANKTGSHWVKVSQQFCVNTDTIHINFKPRPVISLPNDTVICAGTTLMLHPAADAPYTYKWQNGDTANRFTVTTFGVYSVTADFNGCKSSDAVSINVISKPGIKLSDTILCEGEQILLNSGAADQDAVLWQDQFAQHSYVVSTPGIYSVSVSNKCGTDFKTIRIIQKLCKLRVPTAFTPNQDHMNDFFRIKYPNIVKTVYIVVYNRLGQKIFETTDPHKGWDGTVNGIPQPMGTYVWRINYTDAENNKESLSGYVVLIR